MKTRGHKSHMFKRRRSKFVIGQTGCYIFNGGDVIFIVFELNGFQRVFKGVCVSKQCKSLAKVGSSFQLRNIVDGVGVDVRISIYYLCFSFSLLRFYDYERKRFRYRSSKLYYLHDKRNKMSLVKFQWRTVDS